MTSYKEITCATACHRLKRKFPFEWDLNIYRGCEHRCAYCYAVYSHDYIQSDAYFDEIFIKTNIVEQLEKQLSSRSWKRETINIGGVTDSYQPIEAQYQLMPEILRLLIHYKTPCVISTKSDLILRDFDLIACLAEITYVNIALTITCMDESIRSTLEPGGATSLKRFEVLDAFSSTRVSRGLHCMPLVPFLTDGRENIDALFAHGKKSHVTYVLPGILYLRGKTRGVFFHFIRTIFPHLYEPLMTLYANSSSRTAYKHTLYKTIYALKRSYGLNGDYMQAKEKRLVEFSEKQLDLFFD